MIRPVTLTLDEITARHAPVEATVEHVMQSIEERGLLHPVIVMHRKGDHHLLLGANRVEAYRRLGKTSIDAVTISSRVELARAKRMTPPMHRGCSD